MATCVKYKSRKEWLENRGNSIGGSEIASLLGLNKWQSPYDLWLLKTGREQPQEENDDMVTGRYLELATAAHFDHETEHRVIAASEGDILYTHPEYDFLVASPDRRVFLYGSQKHDDRAIYEAKATGLKFDFDEIPMTWFLQPQYYAGIVGYNHVIINWYHRFQNKFFHKIYDFEPEIYENVIDQAVHFWNEYIVKDIPPPARTEADNLKLFPKSTTDKLIVATEEVEEIWLKATEFKQKEKEMTKQYKMYAEKLKMIMKDSEKIVTRNLETMCTYKTNKNGSRVFNLKEL